MPVVNQDFIAADGTSLDTFDSDWDFTTGADANTDIQNNRLELQSFTTVVVYHAGSSEQYAEIVLDPSATGTARRIGPAINVATGLEGQFFYFHNDDGTNYTTIQGHGGSAGWIATLSLTGTYAIAASHRLRIFQTANDGTDVAFDVFVNGNAEGSFVALAAPSVAGNDGIYSRRNDNDSPAVIESFSSGAAVATFSIDAEPTDIQPDDTALEITVSGQATTPTTGNSVVRLDGATGTVLNLTSVRDDTGGVYTLIFDAPAHNAMPDLAYDAAGYTLHVTIDAETNETAEIPFIPPTGYGYVTLTDVTNSDLTALPALVASDQVEYELATSPDSWTVSISALGIITLSGGVNTIDGDTFDVRAWDSTDDTWGPFAEQTGTTVAASGNYTDLIVGEMTYSIQTDIVR